MSRADDSNGENGAGGPKRGDLLQSPIYNWVSIFGAAILVGGLTASAFFGLIDLFVHGASGYGGVTLLPPMLLAFIGFLMFAFGYVRESWRQKRGRHSSFHRQWVIDPTSVIRGASATAVFLGIVIGTLVVLGGGAGSLMLVSYTESNSFCGEVCHTVMTPEATVYTESPHSQIDCVECHVGEGGDSYIRAKLNGLAQVYAAASGNFQRPIATPIHNRRSSQDMCETCHRRDRFIDYKALTRSYFLSGERNESVDLRMLMKIGGGTDALVSGSGIHYHMLIAHDMEYIARDAQKQDIAWVRVTDREGTVKEYSLDGDELSDEERATLETHTIECIDCHSRPAHQFRSPVESVNAALRSGRISKDIPYIKQAAVTALDGDYETKAEALTEIGTRLKDFYEEEYPEALNGNGSQLDTSVAALRDIYQQTIFPDMKADWSAHPDNIGHLESPGCFRCHNDEMLDEDGEPIFTDCDRCHVILSQSDSEVELQADFSRGQEFLHPEDQEAIDEFTLCSDCHTGGAEVYE